MTEFRLFFALPTVLFACNPCPEGYEPNHETEECVQKNASGDTGSGDTLPRHHRYH